MASPATSLARTASPLASSALAAALERFLIENPRACVVEEGAVLFDMGASRWTLEAENGRCTLQIWSDERNLVRTVVGLQERASGLRLEVKRFGQSKPQILRLAPDRDQRTPSARNASRKKYIALLKRVVPRAMPELRLAEIFAAADLEHSFGPAYARGTLERGQAQWALVGANAEESQAAIDGLLTVAVLWLEQCRARAGGRRVVEGVKLVAPAGLASTLRERLLWMHPGAAKWELWELDEAREELAPSEPADTGKLRAHLSSAFDGAAVVERSRGAVERVLGLLAPGDRERVEILPGSPTEIGFASMDSSSRGSAMG